MRIEYPELLYKIFNYGKEIGPRGEETKELMHMHLVIKPEATIFGYPGLRSLEKIWAYSSQELAWYLSGDRSPEFIQNKAKLWSKITNIDGTLNSNYGYLLFYHKTSHPSMGTITMTPFEWALHCLETDINSRRAVMTYNNGGYNFEPNHDYICSQSQGFFIRNNELKSIIALRSSDAIWGLPYNMIWWSLVQQQLYLKLLNKYPDLKLGDIEVDIWSAHIYKKHYSLVYEMIQKFSNKHFFILKEPFELELSIEQYLLMVQKTIEIK